MKTFNWSVASPGFIWAVDGVEVHKTKRKEFKDEIHAINSDKSYSYRV